jgi:hypothetical protein
VREARLNVLFEIELMSNGVVQLLSDLLVEGELSVSLLAVVRKLYNLFREYMAAICIFYISDLASVATMPMA